MTELPATQFAWLGGDRIAYQVFGEGRVDHLICHSFGDTIDVHWDWPAFAQFLRRLASFSRLIMFDRRGSGASDRVSGEPLPSWEAWADEARAVLDAAGSERAVVHGGADSGIAATLFAASHPHRTRGLILTSTAARFVRSSDYPWGLSLADADRAVERVEQMWGTEELAAVGMPDAARDPALRRFFARLCRLSMNRRDAAAHLRWVLSTDVRDVLPSLHVPTLVVHREGSAGLVELEQARDFAERIPHAEFVLVPGRDDTLWTDPHNEIVRHIEQFFAGLGAAPQPDRALAAILFTDIVGSTERAAALGDSAWRDVIDSHNVMIRTIVAQHDGRLIRTTGDGALATFDGPGRAIRAALALRDALRTLGLEIRAGLHTGEVELADDDISGIGVHIAARVLDYAAAGELVVSAAVPMLVAGSALEFEDRGEHELKGVPGRWRLFALVG